MSGGDGQARRLVLGSRGSALALAQARLVCRLLERRWPSLQTSIEVIRTTGDRVQSQPLTELGGKGIFVKEIEEALLDGSIDAAVHSLKDLPSEQPEGLRLSAFTAPVDRRDVLIGTHALHRLEPGARIGTGSPRRRVQLARLRPDLEFVDIRGNVDTRLGKLDGGEYDAIVLAAAGLQRLGIERQDRYLLEPEQSLPAVGQGVLAIETRADDPETRRTVEVLDDRTTAMAVTAERAFLDAMGGGCQVPITAYAESRGDRLWVRAFAADTAGEQVFTGEAEGRSRDAESLGRALARQLIDEGASVLIDGGPGAPSAS